MTKTYKPCSRCGEPHHHWARCKDGSRHVGVVEFKKGDPLRGVALRNHQKRLARTEAGSVSALAVMPSDTPRTTALSAREELKAMADSMTDGPQKNALLLMIERDEARAGHEQAEREIQRSDPTAHVPVPTILRDPSEEKGRLLNREMDRAIFAAGAGSVVEREVLPREAQAVHDSLTGLEERRERKAQEAHKVQRRPAHRPGPQPWACNACHQRFNSGTMEEVRRWAREDPTWRLVCPECGASKVQIIEMAGVA